MGESSAATDRRERERALKRVRERERAAEWELERSVERELGRERHRGDQPPLCSAADGPAPVAASSPASRPRAAVSPGACEWSAGDALAVVVRSPSPTRAAVDDADEQPPPYSAGDGEGALAETGYAGDPVRRRPHTPSSRSPLHRSMKCALPTCPRAGTWPSFEV